MSPDRDDPPNPTPDGTPRFGTESYRGAMLRRQPARLRDVARALGLRSADAQGPGQIAAEVSAYWDAHRVGPELDLTPDARTLLGLASMARTPSLPWKAAQSCLALMGRDPYAALESIEAVGLGARLASHDGDPSQDWLYMHPSAIADIPPVLPGGELGGDVAEVRQVREADGLELILRLSAFWQRLEDAPLRTTQQGGLYKRDRDRLEEDPVLGGPPADAIEPMPDPVRLLMLLAERVGLMIATPERERLDPAPAEFWLENGVHLPSMVTQAWLGLGEWSELAGSQPIEAGWKLHLPLLRSVLLLWLARLDEGRWMPVENLARQFRRLHGEWASGVLAVLGPSADPDQLLSGILLGVGYQLGLLRAAEEQLSGRRVVQLTPFGRYTIGLGPHPGPREAPPQFLFVQPNYEVIAYRQGLTAGLIGQLGRFIRWIQIGAALQLRLTADSVYRGLEGGLTPDAMIERLGRHSARPLPSGLAESVRSWASRRERISYHASATLVEFATPEALEQALSVWPEGGKAGLVRAAPRLLLVEDDRTIPFARFRLAGSRDYRRPAEACVAIGADGITLSLDPGLSDLLIDAELARFADESRDTPAGEELRRRFSVTAASIARGLAEGMSPQSLARWFERRAGCQVPPAVRLLLHGSGSRVEPMGAARMLVVEAPAEDLMDGLWQHPETRPYLERRLGPTTAEVSPAGFDGLRRVLDRLGLKLSERD
ncbi:MAG: helicase-associated domain-containing protein [Isosphaeraceae bacterium]